MVRGVSVCSGIGIGRAVLMKYQEHRPPLRPIQSTVDEFERLDNAIDIFCRQLEHACEITEANFGRAQGAILNAQIIIVHDSGFLTETRQRIREKLENAEYAVTRVLEKYVQMFTVMEDGLMSAREADFRDIKNRLLGIMAEYDEPDFSNIPPGSVVVSEELHTSVMAQLPVQNIAAIITGRGSVHSHTAILSRGRGIPFVTSLGDFVGLVRDGDRMIVDATAGDVFCRPTSEELSRYGERARLQGSAHEQSGSRQVKNTATRDGRPVGVLAEIGALSEAAGAVRAGASAVFVPDARLLSGARATGEQQFLSYKAFVRALEGKKAGFVVGNINLNYEVPYRATTSTQTENQPDWHEGFVRGEGRLKTTISALLRASVFGEVAVIIKHPTCANEMKVARRIFESCKINFEKNLIPFDPSSELGVLIESPAALLSIDRIARQVDFVLLEIDNLALHTLGANRSDKTPPLGSAAFHPAFLKFISQAIKSVSKMDIPIYASGEIAANPMMVPFLIGCGISGIITKPAALPGVSSQCKNLNYLYWQSRVGIIASLPTGHDVVRYLKRNWAERPGAGSWQPASFS